MNVLTISDIAAIMKAKFQKQNQISSNYGNLHFSSIQYAFAGRLKDMWMNWI